MIKRIIIRVLLITFAAHVGCSHAVRVTDADWEEKEDKSGPSRFYSDGEKIFSGEYIFHLTDGNSLFPSEFIKTDSTFVILGIYGHTNITTLDDPLVLPVENVNYIEKWKISWLPTTFLMAAIAGIIGLFIWGWNETVTIYD